MTIETKIKEYLDASTHDAPIGRKLLYDAFCEIITLRARIESGLKTEKQLHSIISEMRGE